MNLEQLLEANPLVQPLALLIALFVGAWCFFFVSRAYLVKIGRSVTQHLPGHWVRASLDSRLLAKISWVLPVAIVLFGASSIGGLPPLLVILIERVSLATLILLVIRAISIFLGNINEVYSEGERGRSRPIKGFIQIAVILLYSMGIILILAVLLDRSPLVFLSGLGAMTAILMLVFKDTILSLVAGFQLTSNDFVRVGDWLEMPQFGADGDVVDIALHAVRVRNWDNTITVIPTHRFLEHSFKNWRGMTESGGRRIKRSVRIDMSSVRFLNHEEIDKLKRFVLLQEHMDQKVKELAEHNAKYASDPSLLVNSRRLTNIGCFRAYLFNYLRQHPKISQEMTLLVRQLEPDANGLPIEIYVFTNDTRWAVYEDIQADIFDHVLAIASEFGLQVFQNPTGVDFQRWEKGHDADPASEAGARS